MIDHEIDDHSDPALASGMSELDEVSERPISRVDPVVVGNVVTVIEARRALEGHQPNGRHSEPMQVIEPAHQAAEITDAIGIRIHVGRDGKAIDDRILVPKIAYHHISL